MRREELKIALCPRIAEAEGPEWFCPACGRVVHDLSAMSEPAARAVVRSGACVRFVTAPDGTLLHRPSRRSAVAAALAAAAGLIVPGVARAGDSIAGVVVDPAGNPVADAVVSLAGNHRALYGLTDAGGRFELDGASLSRGAYRVEIDKEGFQVSYTHLRYGRAAVELAPIHLVPLPAPDRYRRRPEYEGGEPLEEDAPRSR